MNNFFKFSSVSCLAFLMVMVVIVPISAEEEYRTLDEGYYPENSEIYQSASEAMQSMYDLQNSITDTLGKANGKYVYDERIIKSLIYAYNFDAINVELNKKWTKESFYNEVILQVESTEVSSRTKRAYSTGATCGVTKSENIWNSKRDWMNDTDAKRYRNAIGEGLGSTEALALIATGLASLFPGVNAIVAFLANASGGVAATILGRLHEQVATAIGTNGCGIVVDVNLVGWSSAWNQTKN